MEHGISIVSLDGCKPKHQCHELSTIPLVERAKEIPRTSFIKSITLLNIPCGYRSGKANSNILMYKQHRKFSPFPWASHCPFSCQSVTLTLFWEHLSTWDFPSWWPWGDDLSQASSQHICISLPSPIPSLHSIAFLPPFCCWCLVVSMPTLRKEDWSYKKTNTYTHYYTTVSWCFLPRANSIGHFLWSSHCLANGLHLHCFGNRTPPRTFPADDLGELDLC